MDCSFFRQHFRVPFWFLFCFATVLQLALQFLLVLFFPSVQLLSPLELILHELQTCFLIPDRLCQVGVSSLLVGLLRRRSLGSPRGWITPAVRANNSGPFLSRTQCGLYDTWCEYTIITLHPSTDMSNRVLHTKQHHRHRKHTLASHRTNTISTYHGWFDTVWMLLKQYSDKRGALGCRLLLWFGKREAVHGAFLFVTVNIGWWGRFAITPVLEPAMVVECQPRDGTYMTCCCMYRGDMVLKMSTPRWPRPERSAPFRLSTGRGRASIQLCLTARCAVTKSSVEETKLSTTSFRNQRCGHVVELHASLS